MTVRNRITTVATLLFGIAALAALVWLRNRGLFPTGNSGTDTHVVGGAFLYQMAVLAVGIGALQLAPRSWIRQLLVAEGALCLFGYGSLFAAAALIGLAAYFLLLRLPLPARLRPGVSIAFLVGLGVVGASRVFGREPFIFSMLFSMRLLMYGWNHSQNNFPREDIVDFLVYVLAAPLLVILPYMLFVPFPGKFVERIEVRFTEARSRRILFHLALGAAMTAVDIGVRVFLNEHGPRSFSQWVAVNYGLEILSFARMAHVVVALLLLHGIDDRLPMQNPLLATDFAQFWRRFQIHQKDVQVALFYNPALIWLRRSNRYLAIFLAVAWTLFVGNLLIHVLSRYMYNPSIWLPKIMSRLVFAAVGSLVLGATLCLQEWRRRTRHPAPSGGVIGRLYLVACWAATQTFNALIYALP